MNNVAVSCANSLFFLTVSIMEQQRTLLVSEMGINNSLMEMWQALFDRADFRNPVVLIASHFEATRL